MRFPRIDRRRRIGGATAILMAVAVAVVGAGLGLAPVESQGLDLVALRTDETIPIDDPWADVWESARSQRVPLSAQNIAPPFGGGTVPGLVARALHDGSQIYIMVEWPDAEANTAVNGNELFSDAVALQFPAVEGSVPPYTMGGPDSPVNIWQWKAVWQADLEDGFAGMRSRYPDTFADFYPDSASNAALDAGNPLAERDHASPVENLLAAGFGSLTHVTAQDVDGSGEWRDGRWRALFGRNLGPAAGGMAGFTEGEETMVAFAVWDGGAGDRNGQKSIAEFVNLSLSSAEATAVDASQIIVDDRGSSPWPAIAIVGWIMVMVMGGGFLAARSPKKQ